MSFYSNAKYVVTKDLALAPEYIWVQVRRLFTLVCLLPLIPFMLFFTVLRFIAELVAKSSEFIADKIFDIGHLCKRVLGINSMIEKTEEIYKALAKKSNVRRKDREAEEDEV